MKDPLKKSAIDFWRDRFTVHYCHAREDATLGVSSIGPVDSYFILLYTLTFVETSPFSLLLATLARATNVPSASCSALSISFFFLAYD